MRYVSTTPWYAYLKLYRLQREKSLRELEEDTGISNAYLSQLENGRIKKPSFQTIMKLMEFYGKDPKPLYLRMCRRYGEV